MAVDPDHGYLISAFSPRLTSWRAPLLRAYEFDSTSRVACAPGIHAVRYGSGAYPRQSDAAWVRCEIPPRTAAIMSPWALRAERLLVTGICIRPSPYSEVVIDYWRQHCDILPYADQPTPAVSIVLWTAGAPQYEWRPAGIQAVLRPDELNVRWPERRWRLNLQIDEDEDGRAWWRGFVEGAHGIGARLDRYAVDHTPIELAQYWRALLARLTTEYAMPDDITWGWRQLFAGIELGIYQSA